jgi:glutamine synthetase
MSDLREIVDDLESLVADDLWPIPTYRDILFIK